MRPKAGYFDVVLACKDAVAISVIAKDYGWSAKRMNSFLHECGIQFKQGNIWLLYQNHAQKGYTDTKTHIYTGKDGEPHSTVHTYWTQKGRLFIYETMKTKGFLPMIERCNAA
jgi:phage antirepressor YoqD-like protein